MGLLYIKGLGDLSWEVVVSKTGSKWEYVCSINDSQVQVTEEIRGRIKVNLKGVSLLHEHRGSKLKLIKTTVFSDEPLTIIKEEILLNRWVPRSKGCIESVDSPSPKIEKVTLVGTEAEELYNFMKSGN